MVFINASSSLGMVLANASTTITGDIVGTVMIVLFILLAICMMFGIPFEITATILLPFCIVISAYYINFWGVLAIFLLYLGSILAKNFFFR